MHQICARDIFDGFFQLGYNVASMGEFGLPTPKAQCP
jgi:hypothetical protein